MSIKACANIEGLVGKRRGKIENKALIGFQVVIQNEFVLVMKPQRLFLSDDLRMTTYNLRSRASIENLWFIKSSFLRFKFSQSKPSKIHASLMDLNSVCKSLFFKTLSSDQNRG